MVHGADYVTAHGLADGREIWRCGGLNPKQRYNKSFRFVSSPVASGGLIVVPSAKRGPILGLRPTGQGDITNAESHHAWRIDRGTPDVASPLIHDGLVYFAREDGVLLSFEAESGKPVYEQRIAKGRLWASPVLGDGKLYLASLKGEVIIGTAGRQFEVLSANNLNEPITASPVLLGGRLYIRTFKALYAIK